MKKVTIAIPTYNRPEYLPQAIKSVLNQTCQDFEIIVFDSGSDYDVQKLISAFDDSRIKLQKSENIINNKSNFRRIFNFKYDTEYLIVFHDDDMMHPQLIERELVLMEKYFDLVWVGTGINFVKNYSKMEVFKVLSELKNYKIYNSVGLVRLILNNFHLAFNTAMYRTAFIENMDKFSQRFYKWDDRPFLIHLSKKGSVAVIKDKLVNYRMHPGQDSQANNQENLPYFLNLCNYFKDNLSAPLTAADKKLFYSWSSNNLILALAGFSKTFNGYINLLKQCREGGLFRIKYISFRGLWYAVKVFKKYFFS
ncbi:MAG: glycosyltransferase [Methanoregula sp.]|jgi:glycosyltransferase involved in cell wall biosynthesis|nr:glycosyltransferase [Methanoregula sp.]